MHAMQLMPMLPSNMAASLPFHTVPKEVCCQQQVTMLGAQVTFNKYAVPHMLDGYPGDKPFVRIGPLDQLVRSGPAVQHAASLHTRHAQSFVLSPCIWLTARES